MTAINILWPQLAQGGILLLSTVSTIDWVLLESGESNKGQEVGSLFLQLVCRTHLASLGKESVQHKYFLLYLEIQGLKSPERG